nr:TonB-dependent receptor [Helicobacter pylori]
MRFLTEDLYRRSTTRKNPSVPNNGSGFDAGTSLNNFNNYTAVYASDEINFNNGMLTITPGLRYTFLNYEKKDAPPFKAGQTGKTIKDRYNQWNPALNVGYKPIKDWLFYFNYQRSYIPPQFSNIGSFVGTSTDYFQIFNVMEGGSRYYFNNQVSFNANYFVIFANHYFTGRYGDNKEPVNARSQGVELELYYTPIRGLNFHAAYTFIDTNITSHTMVTNPANPKGPKKDIFGKKLPFVSPHQFILDASYTYAKTTIGLSSFFYSRAYSDVLNTVPFTEYAPTIKNGAITTKTAGMTPWYWVWNLQISSTLWERKNQSVNASLQINNIFNMKYWFSGIGTSPDYVKGNYLREGVNAIFQGSASDLLKLGMLKVSERFKNNPSVRLLLQVHDELIFEIEEKNAPELQQEIQRILNDEVYPLRVPLETSAFIAKRWNELKG